MTLLDVLLRELKIPEQVPKHEFNTELARLAQTFRWCFEDQLPFLVSDIVEASAGLTRQAFVRLRDLEEETQYVTFLLENHLDQRHTGFGPGPHSDHGIPPSYVGAYHFEQLLEKEVGSSLGFKDAPVFSSHAQRGRLRFHMVGDGTRYRTFPYGHPYDLSSRSYKRDGVLVFYDDWSSRDGRRICKPAFSIPDFERDNISPGDFLYRPNQEWLAQYNSYADKLFYSAVVRSGSRREDWNLQMSNPPFKFSVVREALESAKHHINMWHNSFSWVECNVNR